MTIIYYNKHNFFQENSENTCRVCFDKDSTFSPTQYLAILIHSFLRMSICFHQQENIISIYMYNFTNQKHHSSILEYCKVMKKETKLQNRTFLSNKWIELESQNVCLHRLTRQTSPKQELSSFMMYFLFLTCLH